MKLYNSMTRQKEELQPLVAGKVSMYVCGPTVYNYIHVGNARPVIVFDALRRYLEYRDMDVTYVQNFTDVDDKIIRDAAVAGVPFRAYAERFIAEYFTDARGLGVRDATVHPKATEHMDGIIEMVQDLIAKGFAYEAEGDVYFRTKTCAHYGALSHQPLEDLEAGARIDVDARKEHAMDFALWKAAKPGEPAWASPWGDGRPGWHIECSVMSNHYLGKTMDIHCGGQDLCFPHHENEIAQSEAANGQKFVNIWLHNGFLNIDNEKMSKSKGNFFTLREVANVYGYLPVRFFMLSAHYRSPINYSQESLEQSAAALERLKTAVENWRHHAKTGPEGAGMSGQAAYQQRFNAAMDDDFNTAGAMGVVFELVRDVNTAVAEGASAAFAADAIALLEDFDRIFGLLPEQKEAGLSPEIEALIELRQAARAAKNWAESDRTRDELAALGITLKDTPQGLQVIDNR